MLHRIPFYQYVSEKCSKLTPGSRGFLKSLSFVTVGFAFSKVFSSIALIVVARFFGPGNFGEATVVTQVAQMLSIPMLLGLQVSLMKFGSSKENPAPQVATVTLFVSVFTLVVAGVLWIFQVQFSQWLSQWMSFSVYKLRWAISYAVILSGYGLFTSALQALNLFKVRTVIEVFAAFLLLPGLVLGYKLYNGNYETVLIAYAFAFGLTIPFIVWRFRHMLSPRHLFPPDTPLIMWYGLFACLSNIGYVLTFIIQPLQIEWGQGTDQVGIYRVFCNGSINTATFASGIFYTVFFPTASVSTDRHGIWRKMTRAWMRGAAPLFLLFIVVQIVTVLAAGPQFPFVWNQIFLFSFAALLITIQGTYGQNIASQGVRGIRWGLPISLLSGLLNFSISYWLIPIYGLSGAITAIAVNYAVTLIATILCGKWLMRTGGLADA